ncbi:MAG: transposase [Endozoicomonadaceae bacterium]|nr:transposase [Endozoicomonadaceae bacterium]
MFRAFLLGTWYRLSDVQLAQCLYRYLLFRSFCHFELGGDVPEASILGRFRTRLVDHHPWDKLLVDINRQLEAKNIIMSEGRINIIDATPIEATQSDSGNKKIGEPTQNSESGWHVNNNLHSHAIST